MRYDRLRERYSDTLDTCVYVMSTVPSMVDWYDKRHQEFPSFSEDVSKLRKLIEEGIEDYNFHRHMSFACAIMMAKAVNLH